MCNRCQTRTRQQMNLHRARCQEECLACSSRPASLLHATLKDSRVRAPSTRFRVRVYCCSHEQLVNKTRRGTSLGAPRAAHRGQVHSIVPILALSYRVFGEWNLSSYQPGRARHACVNACAATGACQVHLPAQRVLDAGACHPREQWTGTPVPLQVVYEYSYE